MARYRQTWNEEKQKYEFIEISSGGKHVGLHYVRDDKEDFISPIDGKVISGQKQYDDHCKRHNVVNAASYDDAFWAKQRKQKDDFYNGVRSRKEVQKSREQMNEVINQLERNR